MLVAGEMAVPVVGKIFRHNDASVVPIDLGRTGCRLCSVVFQQSLDTSWDDRDRQFVFVTAGEADDVLGTFAFECERDVFAERKQVGVVATNGEARRSR